MDKIMKNYGSTKMLFDEQIRDRHFKEAMRTSFSPIPDDDVFRDLLARLDEAERKLL